MLLPNCYLLLLHPARLEPVYPEPPRLPAEEVGEWEFLRQPHDHDHDLDLAPPTTEVRRLLLRLRFHGLGKSPRLGPETGAECLSGGIRASACAGKCTSSLEPARGTACM